MTKNKIIRVFVGVSMQYQHQGLSKILNQHKIKIEDMRDNQMLVFINRQMNKFKVLTVKTASNTVSRYEVLAYTRLPKGQIMNLDAVQYIPAAFSGGKLDYDKALKVALTKKLVQKSSIGNFEAL